MVDVHQLLGIVFEVEQLPLRRRRLIDCAGASKCLPVVVDQLVALRCGFRSALGC